MQGRRVLVATKQAKPAPDSGFAAVDALVALMILAITITLSLRAVETAKRAATSADEMRQATQVMRGLLEAPLAKRGVQTGQTVAFDWRLETRTGASPVGAPGALICDRVASVTARRTGRRYGLRTSEICLPDQTP